MNCVDIRNASTQQIINYNFSYQKKWRLILYFIKYPGLIATLPKLCDWMLLAFQSGMSATRWDAITYFRHQSFKKMHLIVYFLYNFIGQEKKSNTNYDSVA